MFQKFKNHVYLALIFFILSLAQQYGFYAFKGFPIVWLTLGKYFGVFFFFFIFTFTPGPILRFLILSFLLILNCFQMGHLSYFGTQVLPTEIYLFFAEYKEIFGTVGTEVTHILIPLLFTSIPMGIGFFFIQKFRNLFTFKLIPVLVAAYFIYNPVRTYMTGNTWGRQPSTRELAGMNLYLSLSYCLGKIVPSKLESKKYSIQENESLKLKLEKLGNSEWDNIIVVLGESLTPNHMNLFGYARPTTPYLTSLKLNPNFFYTTALSSGVSTDISVAFFLNLGYGEAGGLKAAKGEHCLLKLAKEVGFSTHFLSTQSSEQLRYIAPYLCTAYLDDYRSLETISPATVDDKAAIDRDVLPKLNELLTSNNKKFIMLHQRGSHSPWALRYRPIADIFHSPETDKRINDYDNSVVEFDLFWRELSELLATKKTKNLVIYLSDHGEALGEGKRFGHGFLLPTSFEIPLIIQSHNKELPKRTKDLPMYLPQYNLGLYLAQQLGWNTNQSPHTIMKDYVIYGNDIDGFAGKAAISFGPGATYRFKALP
ncbi:MAG: phosphoethanolamine transferase [Bdellovibrionales bacterium]|nr:phosphoethanolamine transferase [Bdellovibrionales bacterium]